MATTTNYGWTTPDDTGLVSQGAAAIRSLGSSIDTSVKSLNPGTTSGDIDYYTSSTAKARLAKGTAGQVLAMNSGATAPEWISISSGAMTLISTTTFNGTPTTVLSSIPSTYNDLRIVIRLALPATDATNVLLRINNDSTASRHFSNDTSTSDMGGGAAVTFGATSIVLAKSLDNAVTNGLIILDIPDYTNSTTWKTTRSLAISNDSTTTTSLRIYNGVGVYNQTAAVSSLGFLFSSGNATSGSILLYGVK